jgi:TIR domain
VGDVPDASSQGIFVSYRHEDAGPYARLLQHEFRDRIPDARVFMDLDSIKAGLDFTEVIGQALDSSAVLVALIGRQWATLADEEGGRRLDNPDDFVRFEIQTALERGVLVIPVLVDGARPLRRQELPAELQKLARLNALELSYRRYQYDADQLLDLIQEELAAITGRAEAEEKARREAEEQARIEERERARREAEEQARREAEEQARREAEEQARREAAATQRAETPRDGDQMPVGQPRSISVKLLVLGPLFMTVPLSILIYGHFASLSTKTPFWAGLAAAILGIICTGIQTKRNVAWAVLVEWNLLYFAIVSLASMLYFHSVIFTTFSELVPFLGTVDAIWVLGNVILGILGAVKFAKNWSRLYTVLAIFLGCMVISRILDSISVNGSPVPPPIPASLLIVGLLANLLAPVIIAMQARPADAGGERAGSPAG